MSTNNIDAKAAAVFGSGIGVTIGVTLTTVVYVLTTENRGFSFEAALSPKGSLVCNETDLEALRGPLGRGYKVIDLLPTPDQRCAVVRIAPVPVEGP